MKKSATTSVYRFRDSVAFHFEGIDGETVYMPPMQARGIAGALVDCADDIDARTFTISTLGTVEIPPNYAPAVSEVAQPVAGYIARQLDGLAIGGEPFVRIKVRSDGSETFWMNVPVDRLPALVAAVDMSDLGPIKVRTIVNGQNVTVQATGEGFDIGTLTSYGSAAEVLDHAAKLEFEAIDKLRRASRWRAVAAAMNNERD